jgi:hypothetical protein
MVNCQFQFASTQMTIIMNNFVILNPKKLEFFPSVNFSNFSKI